MANKPMQIGYHTNNHAFFNKEAEFDVLAKIGKGVDFILCHADMTAEKSVAENCKDAERLAKAIKELGVDYIANFEAQNFVHKIITTDGYDVANRPDGTHLLQLPKAYMDALNSQGNCWGLMYDELEHTIINRNISLALASKFRVDKPAFSVPETKDAVEQGNILSKQLGEYKKEMQGIGSATLSGEHVFPVLFHKFAQQGIIPNFKSQKESVSNIQFATAAGAALQYHTPLWNCVDMWFQMTFPGHSPEELGANLRFAYLVGVDAVYVEAASGMFDKQGNMNAHGKAFHAFAEEYKGKPRDYNIQDYEPEIGIIRYDDTYWGQGRCRFAWRNMLFGNPKIKTDKKCREWVRAFRTVTQGESGRNGLSWDRIEFKSFLTRHRSFATMNNAVVFDDKVKAEQLKTLKLCFLCGYEISPETAKAITRLVKEQGLTVVTSPRFAPAGMQAPLWGYREYNDGKGTWLVTNSFTNGKLKKRIAPFLGKKGEMRFVFAGKEIRMAIQNKCENFTVLE